MKETSHKADKTGLDSEPVTVINMQPLLQPLATIIAAIIIAVSIVFSGVRTVPVTTTTTGTTTTSAAAPTTVGNATAVTIEQIRDLFANRNLIKFGDSNSKLLFVEVADPSCPFCHAAAGKNPTLNRQMGSQFILTSDGGTYVAPVAEMKKLVDQGVAAYAYIYTPGHGTGEMAMKALYCAYDQGKFWEAHDVIMSSAGYSMQNDNVKNDKTKSQVVVDLIGGVVDGGKLKECIDSGKYDARLTEEQSLAASLGVTGTPGFFINNTNFAGAYSWTDMQNTAAAALQ